MKVVCRITSRWRHCPTERPDAILALFDWPPRFPFFFFFTGAGVSDASASEELSLIFLLGGCWSSNLGRLRAFLMASLYRKRFWWIKGAKGEAESLTKSELYGASLL